MDFYYILNGEKLNAENFQKKGGKNLFQNHQQLDSFLKSFEGCCEKHSPTVEAITEDYSKNEVIIKKCCKNFKEDFSQVNNIKIKYE